MRHQVMLPIEVDTTAIEQKVEHDAFNEVVNWLKQQLMDHGIPKKYKVRWNDPDQPDWAELAHHAANDFMDEHKDELLEAAANKIAYRMAKTKAFKQAIEKVVE